MSNGKLYSGKEMLSFQGKPLPEPYGILQYWRINLSELILNVTRGGFAEFIVQCALDQGGFKCIDDMMSGMEAWDLNGPEIEIDGVERPCRIEVKSCASVQLTTPDEKEPISLPSTKLTFSIARKIDWASGSEEKHHNNDLYVFCHYKAERKSDDILDLDLWDFYVLPTYKIREDKSLADQKTISVWRLGELGIQPVSYDGLFNLIMRTIEDIEVHYQDQKV